MATQNSPKSTMLFAIAAALTIGLPACDSTGETSDSHDSHDSHGEEIETDDYVDGLTKDTENGMFTVKLTSEPSPPIKGMNMWMFEVSDAAGGVEGANITVEPWMPEHGHGSDSQASVSEQSAGMYHANPVDLHMAGVWDTTITIEKDGQSDSVHFVFNIEGEGDDHDHDHDHGG